MKTLFRLASLTFLAFAARSSVWSHEIPQTNSLPSIKNMEERQQNQQKVSNELQEKRKSWELLSAKEITNNYKTGVYKPFLDQLNNRYQKEMADNSSQLKQMQSGFVAALKEHAKNTASAPKKSSMDEDLKKEMQTLNQQGIDKMLALTKNDPNLLISRVVKQLAEHSKTIIDDMEIIMTYDELMKDPSFATIQDPFFQIEGEFQAKMLLLSQHPSDFNLTPDQVKKMAVVLVLDKLNKQLALCEQKNNQACVNRIKKLQAAYPNLEAFLQNGQYIAFLDNGSLKPENQLEEKIVIILREQQQQEKNVLQKYQEQNKQ